MSNRRRRAPGLAGLLVAILAGSGAGAAGRDAGSFQIAAGRPNIVCAGIRQRYEAKATRLVSRELNFFLIDAASRGCLDLVKHLLGEGASVEARDRFGNSAMLVAARMGQTKVLEHLLDAGSDITLANLAGSNAVLRATTTNRRRTVQVLLRRGADANRPNKHGVTPLVAAAYNGSDRLVKLLLDNGADPTLADGTGKAPIIYAAGRGYLSILKALVGAGVDVNAAYGNDLTALMWAAGHANDVPAADGAKMVTFLLDAGADPELADNRGRTALMIAAERGHGLVADLLVARGADVARKDKKGLSARDLAGSEDIKSMLEPAK